MRPLAACLRDAAGRATCFEDFVATPPLAGLGTSVDLIKRIVEVDPVTLDLLDQALQRPDGGDRRSEEAREDIKLNNIKLDNAVEYPQGTSKARAIRHLREKRPDLLERVKAGELSAHAAMREVA